MLSNKPLKSRKKAPKLLAIKIISKYTDMCVDCGGPIRSGDVAWWIPKRRRVRCNSCHARISPVEKT